MAIKTTIEEHLFLVQAENEIAKRGATDLKCPRCGNEIIIEDFGSAYTVRCKTKDCIKAEYSGI